MIRYKLFLMNIYNFIFAVVQYFYYRAIKNKSLIRASKKNYKQIPIIIINYNQLFYLKKMVDALVHRGYKNIVIIDNNSTYPPLKEYYKSLNPEYITLELQKDNMGHMVFFKKKELLQKYATKGYYMLTDADIVPNVNLPEDFALKLINIMEKYHFNITKVGFALRIDDIPSFYPLKNNVLKWEAKYWQNQIGPQLFEADVDTTFALYKPYYCKRFYENSFMKGIRVAGDFTAQHGGWYINPELMTEEQAYYFKTVNSSSSWIFNSDGDIIKKQSNLNY